MAGIRAYQAGDRPAVREIACDTAARGEPVERFFHDRELFADVLTRYYTDWEPPAVWIAEQDRRVVGYLTGCLETGRYQQVMARRIIPTATARAIGRGALLHPSAWRLLAALVQTWRIGGLRRLLLDAYPSHLHVNLRPEARGRRIGAALVERFLSQVQAAGSCGVHAAVRSDNGAAQRFFERLGFAELGRHPVVFPSGAVLERRDTIVYGRRV